MEDEFKNDTLRTDGTGSLHLTLKSEYGQPVATIVVLKKNDVDEELFNFGGNATEMHLGEVSDFRYQRISINSTVQDVQNPIPGQEVEDIGLSIKLASKEKYVQTKFERKTTGQGGTVDFIYEVTLF